MTTRPRPRPGEIALALPHGPQVCHSLDHLLAFRPAAVVATFGPASPHSRAAVFVGCWGRAYPLCTECWHHTQRLAETHRPAPVIRDLRP
jgi:hypothetical protein